MPRPKDYQTKTDRRTKTQFVVACEGEKSEEIYLSFMTQNMRRVEVLPLSTGKDGHSAPEHLLERLKEWRKRNQIEDQDAVQFWMVLDVDHHFEGRHSIGTHRVLNEAARLGVRVVISNPRIELWLLLHFEDVTTCPGDYCEQRLSALLGSYNHSKYNPAPLASGLSSAIRRAQSLDITPHERIPPLPGTQLYRLMFAIVNA